MQCGAKVSAVRDNPGGYVKAAKLEALREQMVTILSERGMLPEDKLHGTHPDRDFYMKEYGKQIGYALRVRAHESNPERDVFHSKNSMFASKVSINKKVLPTAPEGDREAFRDVLRAAITVGKAKGDGAVAAGGPTEQVARMLEGASAAHASAVAVAMPSVPTGAARGGRV